MTTVYFVRHAQPDLQNHDDKSRALSEKGLKDRALVTAFFNHIRVDAVCSSPYKRAYDTVCEMAKAKGLPIRIVEDFRERAVSDGWIADFDAFVKRQWEDFSYHLPDGESLYAVQGRNIAALSVLLQDGKDQVAVIGSHGTAISTVLHYYRKDFGYDGFMRIKDKMPWIVRMDFEDDMLIDMQEFDLLDSKMEEE